MEPNTDMYLKEYLIRLSGWIHPNYSQDNAGVAFGQITECPCVAQPMPTLEHLRTYVDRSEEGRLHTPLIWSNWA